MGVPKFFRYISERYPCLWELIKEHQIPEFDYLYLDMNGIIHTCSHPNDSDVSFRITEENIFKNIFHYIEVLFNMIRPKKLFFMAIDGVAPRAKINQQRGRRFRAAKDAEMQENKAMQKGITLPTEKRFDSNCITPGTFFMAKLGKQLKRFIEHKISTDDGWKKCKVMFSGCEVPGEGEHKIMDYIRFMKASEDYDCNSRHCLYGLDADLIMLGLCSHEPNFSLLREEVKFGKQHTTTTPERTKFCLLHLSLLREYIEHEFSPLKDKLPFPFDIEKIIDDWVLMGFLVGNDFIPHLPNLHINRGALPILYRAYMEVLPTLKGYINESGTLNLEHFEKFMEKLGSLDVEQFKEHYADLKYFESKTGRKPNETERHVYKKLEDGEIASPKRTNKDLDALIKSTTEMCLDNSDDDDDDDFMMDMMDMIDDESDSEVYTMEFVQHKRDYYMNKLEYDNVDAEVLRSQAEGYVRAIQWNLHYYYHGCCSWSWYYPHHYAPYISDIKDFKNLKLEFELGEPFLPFQQLLAVLPAYSKDLLPVAFQSLLTEDSSPIISYYPNNFKTDLNGKQQEWEAVVLIPFIDEKLLLAAMEPHLSKLTAEEQARNRHGPMCLYSYTEETRNVYQETMYFSQFTSHAQVRLLNRDDIFVPREKLVRGLSPGFDCTLYYPGFPTMRHLRHTAHLEKAKVRVFQQTSSGDNMILRLESEETPNLETLASELLGKSVYVGWPNLKEALVVSASDCKMRIILINHLDDNNPDNLKKESMKNIQDWNAERKTIKETHMSRHGIDIGDTSVLLHARLYLGNKYVFDDQGKVTMEKQWSDLVISYACQTIVTDVSTFRVEPPAYESVHNIFTPGTFCFMLGHPYYGAMGEVVQNKDNQKRRIKVSMKIAKEPIFDRVKQAYMQQKTRYMHGSTAAQRLGISSHLLSRITGTIYVIQAANEEFVKHNVGLNLKFNKKNEEVTGYTRKDNGQWLYSPKAVQLIRAYTARCPELFSRLHQNVMSDIFQEEELFGTTNSKELQETVAWLKEELRGMGSRTCGMDALEPDLVKQIEEEVDKYLKSEDSKAKSMFMQVKPQLLFKPGLHLPSVPPDPNSQNRLFDRICCVRSGFTVPLGAKGTIIGTRKNATDTVYDVLFDTPFIGGLTLNGCSEFRGYHLTATDFINISFGERTEQGSATNELTECRKQTIPTTAIPSKKIDKVSHTQMQLAKKGLEKLSRDIRISMMQRGEMVSNTKMAPQQLQGASVPAHNQSSEFQALWDELHKIQKPNETPEKPAVLATPMKVKPPNNHNIQSIPDVSTQTSEQQNKTSAQNTTSSRKVAGSQTDQTSKPPPLVQQLFDRARRAEEKKEKVNSVWYTSQLLRYFSHSRFGIPKYKYTLDEKTGLITARIMVENSKVYTGDPCVSHEQATESVAKKVYEALNLNKAPDAKMVMAPRQQWYNSQPNTWVQNVRHPAMPMSLPKIPPIPQSLPMQRNTFYPRWNQNLPSTAAFVQTTLYQNQNRHAQQGQQQMKQQGHQQAKYQAKQGQQKNSQREEPRVEIRNSTAFVPLQAQKNSRNLSARQTSKEADATAKNSSPKVQQRQKKEETPKGEKPENANKAKVKEATSSVQPRQQVSQQPQQNTGKLSKPRKSRVAAKFGAQPLMNGGEPSK